MKDDNTLWMVQSVVEEAEASWPPMKVDFKSLADGCAGVSLWFDDEAKARTYAGDKYEVSKAVKSEVVESDSR